MYLLSSPFLFSSLFQFNCSSISLLITFALQLNGGTKEKQRLPTWIERDDNPFLYLILTHLSCLDFYSHSRYLWPSSSIYPYLSLFPHPIKTPLLFLYFCLHCLFYSRSAPFLIHAWLVSEGGKGETTPIILFLSLIYSIPSLFGLLSLITFILIAFFYLTHLTHLLFNSFFFSRSISSLGSGPIWFLCQSTSRAN